MTFNNTYTLKEDNLKKLLDKVEEFIISMNCFTTKHKSYTFKIELEKHLNMWDAKINIKDEKQDSIKRIKKTI